MLKCDSCGREMKPLFNGNYCENHCDLPADKAATARKKDQETRANSQPAQANPAVAGKVPAPYQLKTCPGDCGQPENWVTGVLGDYCGNYYHFMGSTVKCGYIKPNSGLIYYRDYNRNPSGPITINWGGGTIDVIPDPDCPVDRPYFIEALGVHAAHPALINYKKCYPELQRDRLVPAPAVQADSSPPAASRVADYSKEYRGPHHGHTDWHEASYRELMEYYRR